MKTQEFKYSKDGVTSDRRVMVYESAGDSIVGIDLSHLDAQEIAAVKKITEDFDEAMKPYVAKAFRRFKKSQIID